MGPTCRVYGRCELTDNRLLQIDTLLSNIASMIESTRKGRLWNVRIDDRPVHVCVEITDEVVWECEDELLELNMLPDDAPFRVSLSTGLNGREDYILLHRLASKLVPLINGVSTKPEK